MARKPAALRKKEDIEAVPSDQEVTIDISDDDPIITLESDDEPAKKEPPKREAPVIKEPPPAQKSDLEVADLKRQLADLKRAQDAAAWQAQQRDTQYQVNQVERNLNEVISEQTRWETEARMAKQAIKDAFDRGDSDALANAQEKLGEAAAETSNLARAKAHWEGQLEQYRNQTPAQTQPQVSQADPLEAHIAALPELAKSWLRQHREYMENEEKNVDLQMAHLKARKSGIEPYSKSYIEFVEQELGMRAQPQDDDDEPEPTRSRTVSAPVTRDVPSPTTGRPQSNRVTLNAEERDMARSSMPHLSHGDAEREYARQKMKLNGLKAQGHYRDN